MNSRLHFKISTSSFRTKLFCLCTRALRGNRLHRPFRARGDRGYFSPFSPRPPTPPTVRPRFTQIVHPISFPSSPLPQIHSRTLSGTAVLTPAVCPLFGVKPTSTAVTYIRSPLFYSQFGNIRNEIGRGIARKYASPRWRAVTNRLLNANPVGPRERHKLNKLVIHFPNYYMTCLDSFIPSF